MESLAREFAGQRVQSVFIYTREAHPGELRPPHADFADKLERAREAASKWGLERAMLVDDFEGTLHRAYGTLPNMTWLVGRGGRILYKAAWTDPRSIRLALEHLSFERSEAKEGRRMMPFYMEWLPTRSSDLRGFFDGLLHGGGERAVTEYIDALAASAGEAHVAPHRRMWAAYQDARNGGPGDDSDDA